MRVSYVDGISAKRLNEMTRIERGKRQDLNPEVQVISGQGKRRIKQRILRKTALQEDRKGARAVEYPKKPKKKKKKEFKGE